MAKACVTRKRRKMGTRGATDSLTPRRFSSVRTSTPEHGEHDLAAAACDSGRKLKMASAPLAMERVMVST